VLSDVRLWASRWSLRLPAVALALLVLAWVTRDAALTVIGAVLVAEDPLQPAEVLVVSMANGAADAIEVGRLYREGYGREIVVPTWRSEPVDAAVRALGVPHLGATELATAVLEHSGVPRDAVHVLPGSVDGTETEVAAVAAFARERQPVSLMVVTARSHAARAKWLLRRALPSGTQVMVRSPRDDAFEASSWWHSRDEAREAMAEYLRWINTLLGDLWR